MDRSGVSRAFKEFEEKDLIIREVDEKNKRAYKMALTDKGIKSLLHLGPDDQPHRAEGCVTPSKGAEDESKEGLAQAMGTVTQRGEAGRIG